MFKSRSVCDQLDDLLEKERMAVLKADFEVLKRLVVKKERLVADLTRHSEPVERISLLKRKMDRNGQLLRAAGAGIRTVTEFIKKLEEPHPVLNTYDQTGSRSSHPIDSTTTERRV